MTFPAAPAHYPWYVNWTTFSEETGEQFHEEGFPWHGDAIDFRDKLESADPDAYDISIYDV